MRRLTKPMKILMTCVALTASGGPAAGQDSAAAGGPGRRGARAARDAAAGWGHGLTDAEAAAGWVSLFDGKTTFGWAGAKLDDGRLGGGTTTTEIGDCELRDDFDRGGTLVVGGKSVTVDAGRL